MNREATKTRSEQRIEQLINCGRPLSDQESDELYRALHADYMRKWRLARAASEHRRLDLEMSRPHAEALLDKLREEATLPEWHGEEAA